jgi:hypothetical protein
MTNNGIYMTAYNESNIYASNNLLTSNYQLYNSSVSGIIYKKYLVAFYTGVNRLYNTINKAKITWTISGIITGDTVDISSNYIALFRNYNVGTNINIDISNINLYGPSSNNYFISISGYSYANISKAPLVGALYFNKQYDLTISAYLTSFTLSGIYNIDISNVYITNVINTYYNTYKPGHNLPVYVGNATISGPSASNYYLQSYYGYGDIINKALYATFMQVLDKRYDGTVDATPYVAAIGVSLSGLFQIDSNLTYIGVSSFKANFDNPEIGYDKTIYITDIQITDGSNNYAVYDTTITGNIIPLIRDKMYLNSTLQIDQNVHMYGNTVNEPNDFDYVLMYNVSQIPGIYSLTNIFNTITYIQNVQNYDDVNVCIELLNSSLLMNTNFIYNWNTINNHALTTIGMGLSTATFGTFKPYNQNIGNRFLEIMAHKIFGHAQAQAAISNDNTFFTHDAEIWDHLSNTVSNKTYQRSIFDQYVALGRMNLSNAINNFNVGNDNNINYNIPLSDTTGNVVFNLLGMSIDFPMILSGRVDMDETLRQMQSYTNVLNIGPNVGGTTIDANGFYNIPILVRFHD